MTLYSIKPNINIFASFIGLTVSGYYLAKSTCDKELLKLISRIEYNEGIANYFKQARTSTCKVNPYWPRAFLLSLSCLFVTEEYPHVYIDFQNLLSYIDSLSQINHDEKNDKLIHWMEKLPAMIDEIQGNALVQDIWLKYVSLVKKNIDLLEPVLDDMIHYQYAWAYDEDSWLRVFEENFIRAASIWTILHEKEDKARNNSKLHEDDGFIYVPVILEEFFSNWNGLSNFREFVKYCLRACFERKMVIDSYKYKLS